MKIAITATNNSLNSKIPDDFKSADYFLIINTDNAYEYVFIPNMYNRSISGAEIFCSNFLIKHEIELFICGKYNQQAKKLLTLAGTKVFHMPNTGIKELFNFIKYEKGEWS